MESVVVPQSGEVRRAAARRSVRGRAGTPWTWSSLRTAVRGRRAVTLSPARHMSHSTVSVSCTPPGGHNRTTGDSRKRVCFAGRTALQKNPTTVLGKREKEKATEEHM